MVRDIDTGPIGRVSLVDLANDLRIIVIDDFVTRPACPRCPSRRAGR